MTGTPSRTARVPTARWDLKEAGGKPLTRGTRTASEAWSHGRGRVGTRSPKSSGMWLCICGGYGGKVTRLTLGDLYSCLRALGIRAPSPTKQTPRMPFVFLGPELCLQLPSRGSSRSSLQACTVAVQLGVPGTQGLQGTHTPKSLPDRLSPHGYQRQSRRCAPCLAHPQRKKGPRGAPSQPRTVPVRTSARQSRRAESQRS